MNRESSRSHSHLSETRIRALETMANRLRRHSLLSTTAAKSGHPSTCFSCAELVSTIFFDFLRYDLENPGDRANDRFVLSKGHAAPILWAALAEAGAFPVEDLLTLRKIDSELEGHPTPRNRYVDVGTGSLGQGLSNAVGMALSAIIDGVDNRVFVLLGDGEVAEGSVWEAAALAAYRKLGNLIALVDVNRLGQSEPTMHGHNLQVYDDKFRAFGWKTEQVDGHNVQQVWEALERAVTSGGDTPTAILARTIKGKGVSFMEDKDGWHGKPVTDKSEVDQALRELGAADEPLAEELSLATPVATKESCCSCSSAAVEAPSYPPDAKVATREAYGSGLVKLGAAKRSVVALDGDCKNSTFSDKFRKAYPDRFFECYIAEQNMVGVAAGLASMGKIAFASSFACFLTRAYDFIRMSSISQVNLKLCGSHAGVSIGEDGPSQMALEDLAMMRAVGGSIVLYPSDAVSAEKLVVVAAEHEGIAYIRTSRPKTPILYSAEETFEVGGSKVIRSSDRDQATVVGAGITLHEALKAYDELKKSGITIRVIDLYSVKPVDQESLARAAKETGRIITVEDHYPEGGLGEAVRSALADVPCICRSLAVTRAPRSGGSEELLDFCGISAAQIVEAVKRAI